MGSVEVEGKFCVDRFEGSLVETSGGSEKPWPANLPLLSSATYKAVSQSGRLPQGYISGEQAAKACAAAGKRLCTNAEWVQACRGPKNTDFPYGAAYQSGACNEHGQDPKHKDPMHRLFGATPAYDMREMNDPRLNLQPETVEPGGTFSSCKSGYGAYDMVGNLHEWVSDVDKSGRGRFNGGYFNEADQHGPGCTYKTTAHLFAYHDYSTGFRCCSDYR
jgi:formylglycine-generating enzyme required for sulfatase activity